jgi:hypothetical protein
MNTKLFTKIGRLAIVVAVSAIAATIGATTTTQIQLPIHKPSIVEPSSEQCVLHQVTMRQ